MHNGARLAGKTGGEAVGDIRLSVSPYKPGIRLVAAEIR
jgi:hypothetical protein